MSSRTKIAAAAILAASFGVAAPAHANPTVAWHQTSQTATRQCPRVGGCYYTYVDGGYFTDDGSHGVKSGLTGVVASGVRTGLFQLAHGSVVTFTDQVNGSTVAVST